MVKELLEVRHSLSSESNKKVQTYRCTIAKIPKRNFRLKVDRNKKHTHIMFRSSGLILVAYIRNYTQFNDLLKENKIM